MSAPAGPALDRPVVLSGAGGAPTLAVERFALPCGLDVVVHPDLSLPQVAVHVAYHVGSSDDPPGRSGLAHLFEHVFKNSAHLEGRHHYEILRRIGAADANASTGIDRTSYHQVVPAHQLEVALWLESDRMGYFLPAMTAARLAAQQQVVRSERRQRYENTPYGQDRFATAAALYPADHPLHHLVIGEHEDIAAVTLEEIFAFYRTWYVPANAHLVIAGAVEVATARRLVERFFGSFPASTRPARTQPAEPAAAPAASSVTVQDRFATLGRLHLAWRGPPPHSEEAAALEMLAAAWAQPGTGALWKRLVYELQLAQRVSVWMVSHRLGTELHVTADLRDQAAPERVAAELERELARVCGEPFDAAALARVVARREAAMLWSLQGLARRAADVQRHLYWYGQPNAYGLELARARAVEPAAVQRASQRTLAAGRIEVRTQAKAAAEAAAVTRQESADEAP